MTSPAEIETALATLRASEGDPTDLLAALEELGDRMKADLDEAEIDEAELDALWDRYGEVQKHLEGAQILRGPDPLGAATAARRPDLVTRLGTDAAFSCALEQTAAQVAKPYYDTKAGWIYAVAGLATTEPRRVCAVEALAAHVDAMVKARMAGGDLVNAVALVACARALARLRPVEAVEIVEAALRFCFDRKCHFEAVEAGGGFALGLAAAEATGKAPAIDAYLERWDSVYPGARYVMEAHYASWFLAADAAGPRAYLEDEDKTKGHAFAAAALADLNAREAAPTIAARLGHVTNAVTREVLREALARLEIQTAPPPLLDRMIFLFGLRTPSEIALGEPNDDIFVARARITTGDPELGTVTEADDGAEDD